ncbi:MAG: hypothetical protein R2751_19610 [Bacteroidales bacterium]
MRRSTWCSPAGNSRRPPCRWDGAESGRFPERSHVDKLFWPRRASPRKSGLTYLSISDIVVKRAMIESAEEVFVVADSSKVGKSAFASLGALSLIDTLITDSGIPESAVEMFSRHDIRLLLC